LVNNKSSSSCRSCFAEIDNIKWNSTSSLLVRSINLWYASNLFAHDVARPFQPWTSHPENSFKFSGSVRGKG
jgi:hypothetical protein